MFREYMVWISGDCISISGVSYCPTSNGILPVPSSTVVLGQTARSRRLGRQQRHGAGLNIGAWWDGGTDRTQPLAVRLQNSELGILPVGSYRRRDMSAQLSRSNNLNCRQAQRAIGTHRGDRRRGRRTSARPLREVGRVDRHGEK